MSTEKTEQLDPRIVELLNAGAHFGLTKTRRHPSVKGRILVTKNKTDIINANNTIADIEKAQEFIKSIFADEGKILLVGTKPEVRDITSKFVDQTGSFGMTYRWVGGALTNLPEIKKRLHRLEEIRKSQETGDINKYTKKERGMMEKEAEKLNETFGGLLGIKDMPEAVFLVDAKYEDIAKKEAKKLNIPVIAITNTDTNIKGIDYPIIANDSSTSSVNLILSMLFNK